MESLTRAARCCRIRWRWEFCSGRCILRRALLALLLIPTTGIAFSDVLVDALMVVTGQPRGLTGRLQSVQWAAMYLATILAGSLGGWLSQRDQPQLGFLICGMAALLNRTWACRCRRLWAAVGTSVGARLGSSRRVSTAGGRGRAVDGRLLGAGARFAPESGAYEAPAAEGPDPMG